MLSATVDYAKDFFYSCFHDHKLSFKTPPSLFLSRWNSICFSLFSQILTPPIPNSVHVTILQHALECNFPFNSTRIAKLGLNNLTVTTVLMLIFNITSSSYGSRIPTFSTSTLVLTYSLRSQGPKISRWWIWYGGRTDLKVLRLIANISVSKSRHRLFFYRKGMVEKNRKDLSRLFLEFGG